MTPEQSAIIFKCEIALGYAEKSQSRLCEDRLRELLAMLRGEFGDE